MNPLPAPKALDTFYLEARSKLLDLAAILDRINRGKAASSLSGDERLQQIHRALEVLQDESGGRTERIQQVFSLQYDAQWEKPKPK